MDYIIFYGKGGFTGTEPTIYRDNISILAIPTLGRARRHLKIGNITYYYRRVCAHLMILPKHLLGADAIAQSKAAVQTTGYMEMGVCNTNASPVDITAQDPELESASTEPIKILVRACGNVSLGKFSPSDLTTLLPANAKTKRCEFWGRIVR